MKSPDSVSASTGHSNQDSLDLIEAHVITSPVIEPRCARALVVGDFLGVFERAAVLQIGRDAGGSECVAPDGGGELRSNGAAFDHGENVEAMQALRAENATGREGSKEGTLSIGFYECGVQIRVEVFLGLVMSRDIMELATFLM